jgi:hypothetical protein
MGDHAPPGIGEELHLKDLVDDLPAYHLIFLGGEEHDHLCILPGMGPDGFKIYAWCNSIGWIMVTIVL